MIRPRRYDLNRLVRRPAILWAAVLGIALTVAGCGDAATDAADTLAATRCELTPRLVASLGAEDDESSLLTNEGFGVEVERLGDGGWVLIGGYPFLPTPLKYDATGSLLGGVGQVGDGPGEFQEPSALARAPSDSIWVSDSRGRIVILDSTGIPARTIGPVSSPEVQGFTPEGRPFGTAARRSTTSDEAYSVIRVYTEDGEVDRLVGPGNTNPAADWYFVGVAKGRAMMVSESAAIAGFGPTERTKDTDDPVWMSTWTDAGEDPLLMKSDILDQLESRIPIQGSHQLRNVAIQRSGDGRLWNLAAVGEYPPGETESSRFFGLTAGLANAAYNGLILLLEDGKVLGAAEFEDAPVGFASESHFFSMVEDSVTGLVTVRIWEIESSNCGGH